jgi:hypothetical protein
MTAGSAGHRRGTVADAMIRFPKICCSPTTVAAVHDRFRDDHVHALLIVHDAGLLAVWNVPTSS